MKESAVRFNQKIRKIIKKTFDSKKYYFIFVAH
jgi:hypothetical protein